MTRSSFIYGLLLTCLACALTGGCKSSSVAVRDSENSSQGAQSGSGDIAAAGTNSSTKGEDVAAGKQRLPNPKGFVNDFAGVLDDETKQKMEAKLLKLQQRANVNFAVVTIETTNGEPLFDYSLAVARQWGIGNHQTGDGLLLMIATSDRQWRIQLSRSLEDDITNEEAARLGQQMIPDLKQRRYGDGLMKCVDATIKSLAARKGFKLDQ
jgi:uncharacterized protein